MAIAVQANIFFKAYQPNITVFIYREREAQLFCMFLMCRYSRISKVLKRQKLEVTDVS